MGKSKPQTTTQTTSAERRPLAEAMPLINEILQGAQGLPEGFNPTQQQAIDALTARAGQPSIGEPGQTGIDTLTGLARGDMVGVNPALQEALAAQRGDIESSILGRFAAAGRSGLNPAVARSLGGAIAQRELPLIAQDIATQQGRQAQAAQGLMGAIPMLQQAGIFGPNLALRTGSLVQDEPYMRLQRMAGLGLPIAGLGGTSSGATTQQVQQAQPSGLQTALGIGGTLLGAALGGPMGASIGGQLGGTAGGMFGGGAPGNSMLPMGTGMQPGSGSLPWLM